MPKPPLPSTAPPLLAALLTALSPLTSMAHGPDDGAGGDGASHWGLGLAVMPETRAYRDFDNKTEVWPILTFENRWVRVLGPGLEFKLGRTGPLSYGLTVGYARDGYKASDSPFLAGMDKRQASAWIGGRLGLQTGQVSLSADWSGDMSSHSKGQKLRLGAEHRIALGEFGLAPRLTVTWLDSKYVDYYYGVKTSEVRADRAAYLAGSTVNTELGLRLDYRIAPQQMLFADLGVTALGSAIKRSPLVDRSTLPEVRLGYLYRF
ncbi:MipA/OmpV family protein [Mitsuaria sp. WAJ17]|uniref:MipA/OmpV family protein n=1 Tax=Mitsuaria sp. WAJ17 TaxID=2761452 RepID=UPI0016015825|nr:MipA/OmpV family protein [Mitsuaria sp. WAJ17]MBB2487506.1 MipA/OmpV family protein [Mitsuaria sp. WAJ17]